MNLLKRSLGVLISVAMVLSTVTVALADATTYEVGTADEWAIATSAISSETEGEFVIELTGDFTANGGLTVNGAKTVTLLGNGHTIDASGIHVLSNVNNGATLNLGNETGSALTIVGGYYNDLPGLVIVKNANLNMYDGVTLKDSVGSNYFGGGVTVQGGTFNMYGGKIDNCGIDGGSVCYGGGVAVIAGGTFTMNGGEISNCYTKTEYWENDFYIPNCAGGGVFVTYKSEFIMNGGKIINCEVDNLKGIGGGVCIQTDIDSYWKNNRQWGYLDSSFIMNGGEILNNSATVMGGGIYVGGLYTNAQAIATEKPSTGKIIKPGIEINKGKISGNRAGEAGGGVFLFYVRPTIPTNIGNAEISNNSAYQGGGVAVMDYYTSLTMDSTVIKNNKADIGAGVSITDTSENTYLKNVTIVGNETSSEYSDTPNPAGGGIYYNDGSKVYLSGANNITENTSNGKLNNVNVLSKSNPIYINGSLAGSTIGLSDPTLWGDGKTDADVTAVSHDYLTSGYSTYNTVNPSEYFVSDHETWSADYSDVNTNEVRLVRGLKVIMLPYQPDESVPSSYSDKGFYNNDTGVADEDSLGVIRYVTQVINPLGLSITELGFEAATKEDFSNKQTILLGTDIPQIDGGIIEFAVDVANIPFTAWDRTIFGRGYAKSVVNEVEKTTYAEETLPLSVGASPKWVGNSSTLNGYQSRIYE